MRDRLRIDPDMLDEISTQIIIPPIYHMFNNEQLKKVGVVQRYPASHYNL